jgi:hypothetical protein
MMVTSRSVAGATPAMAVVIDWPGLVRKRTRRQGVAQAGDKLPKGRRFR